jgi:hypothetical protein
VHGLTVTLFERLQRTLGLQPLLLDRQYRMNPAISGFPSHQFYGVCTVVYYIVGTLLVHFIWVSGNVASTFAVVVGPCSGVFASMQPHAPAYATRVICQLAAHTCQPITCTTSPRDGILPACCAVASQKLFVR